MIIETTDEEILEYIEQHCMKKSASHSHLYQRLLLLLDREKSSLLMSLLLQEDQIAIEWQRLKTIAKNQIDVTKNSYVIYNDQISAYKKLTHNDRIILKIKNKPEKPEGYDQWNEMNYNG